MTSLRKAGPFVGPKGGKWADSATDTFIREMKSLVSEGHAGVVKKIVQRLGKGYGATASHYREVKRALAPSTNKSMESKMTDEDKLEAAKMQLLARMTGKQEPGALRPRTSRVPARVRSRQPHQEPRPLAEQRQSARQPAPPPRAAPRAMVGRQEPGALPPRRAVRVPPPVRTRQPHQEPRPLAEQRQSAQRPPQAPRGRMTGYQEPGALRPRTARVPAPVRTRQPHQERRPLADQRQSAQRPPPQAQPPLRRSFVDQAGRVLVKGGLHNFKNWNPERDAKLPAKYLFDYLCSFIEEAYEHEKHEPMHRKVEAADLPVSMARAIMGELVQTLPKNPNLMRACKKYSCTQDTIEKLLIAKGIMKPKSDTLWTDSDGARAMGADILAEAEVMSYSKPATWLQNEPAPRAGIQLRTVEAADASSLVTDDHVDPALQLAMRKSVELRQLWPESLQAPAHATMADNCPVHGGRDMTKSMNLFNPMQPCTCNGKANAYG